MGKSQRSKGYRRERQVVDAHRGIGIACERVPLSGGAGYRGQSHDIDVSLGFTTLVCEVKSRGKGQGFRQLTTWLSDNDAIFLIADREPVLVTVPWRTWALLLERLKR